MRISGSLSIPVAGIEDPASCLLHAGGLLVLARHAASLVRTGQRDDHRLALSLFVASAITCLAVSAFYHTLAIDHPWKATVQRTDHAMIFLLIAGTLTPIHAIGLEGRVRIISLSAIWLLALSGIVMKTLHWSTLGDGVGLALYLGLSFAGVGAFALLPRRIPIAAFGPLAAGGAAYIGGALLDFHGVGVLVPGYLGPHEILHASVLLALAFHWRFVQRVAHHPLRSATAWG